MLFHVSCRWSLLEKYSCKASKLHLKPRRFKLFIEALEHQLLKDRRKSIRKRTCQGENLSSASLGNISSHSRERGLDNRPFKLILSDGQNVKKLGPGRASTKHGESLSVNLGDEKEDTAFGRGGRQRRKQGSFFTSFYACLLDRQFSSAPYCVCFQCSHKFGHYLLLIFHVDIRFYVAI
jgi:hypothetical protein